jgi:quercetin 2,3-dioxygenase
MKTTPRPVDTVVDPRPTTEGAGVLLKRCIGGRDLDHCDPFLLLDHFGSDDPEDYLAGFPMHPHRGIETVTYMLEGDVTHRDTLGNEGTIGAGDVQWMTSGGGIMHEEMPHPPREGGSMGGFQLWVNMPAGLKMSQPRYQDVPAEQIPTVSRDDGVEIRVVAGEVDGVTGPVKEIYAEPVYLDVSVPAATRFAHSVAADHTVFAYAFEGAGRFGVTAEDAGVDIVAPRLVVFGEGDEVVVETSGTPVRFLLVAGRPLGEPIARYGPFVMNTREEIEQALRDLRDGTFVWREPEAKPGVARGAVRPPSR